MPGQENLRVELGEIFNSSVDFDAVRIREVISSNDGMQRTACKSHRVPCGVHHARVPAAGKDD
jgi:hypothetical protein